MAPFLRAPLDFYADCARRSGDLAVGRIAHLPICVVSHPRHVEQILVRDSEAFVQSGLLRLLLGSLVGDGLLVTEGNARARLRPLVGRALDGGKWTDAATRATDRLASSWALGERRDIFGEMSRVVSEVLRDALLGAHPAARRIGGAVEHAVGLAARRMHDFSPALALRYHAARRAMHEQLAAVVSHIPGLSDRELRGHIVMTYVAAHQNTAALLIWIWHLLSQHPQAYQIVRDEVTTSVDGRLRYCERVVKESLRLYPPVWQLVRQAARDVEIDGCLLRAGTQVLMSQWVMQRDARWFDEPDTFDPDRWQRAHPDWTYTYFPFGLGARECLGQRIALSIATVVVSGLTRRFRFCPSHEQPVTPFPAFALRPRDPLLLEARAWTGS